MSNFLASESSRYLLQHANNPVNWYPWGERAFNKAQAEDKPVFLSIGYSACHWCHVMAHESFEDKDTAALLNQHFINIKVDREERPDLDRIYMNAVQALTGSGGWPMSVFTTPNGAPFYGGTYFPAQPRPGIPSFKRVLLAIVDAWEHRREDLLDGAEQLIEFLEEEYEGDIVPATLTLSSQPLQQAYKWLQTHFDAVHGGWGDTPKFPHPMALELLLRHAAGDTTTPAMAMVKQTLQAMARGGIYDQLGGGFHRYTVDANWLTPHFERMLYDNAQLARVYLHAWQATADPSFRTIAEETLDYILREMTSPTGGFYATQDADSEGEEGKFYTWTADEVREVLGGPATRFMRLYGITETGNFEGKNILTFQGSYEEREAIAGARHILFAAREKRVSPGRDEKILTSWNGLMLAAFAEAAHALHRDDYRAVAQRNAEFLLQKLRDEDGRLWHMWNQQANVAGLLEDYTHLVEGLLALSRVDTDARWHMAAEELADIIIEHFAIDSEPSTSDKGKSLVYAGFYDTADDTQRLIVRPRDVQDNAMPSGNAMATKILVDIARHNDKALYTQLAHRNLAAMEDLMGKHPLAFGQWLVALYDALGVRQGS